jgi:acyl carrier protein
MGGEQWPWTGRRRRTASGTLASRQIRSVGSTVRREVGGLATVFERVRSIVAERLGVDEEKVTMEAEFIGDLNADSLDLVEVIMALEQEFDTEVKDEDAENIRTVGDAVNFIEEHGG